MSIQQIVPGIVVSSSGQADVDSSLADVLFDLALQLEESTGFAVDVEHVVAAVVLASRAGQIDAATPLVCDSDSLVAILQPHVKTVFSAFGGSVGED